MSGIQVGVLQKPCQPTVCNKIDQIAAGAPLRCWVRLGLETQQAR